MGIEYIHFKLFTASTKKGHVVPCPKIIGLRDIVNFSQNRILLGTTGFGPFQTLSSVKLRRELTSSHAVPLRIGNFTQAIKLIHDDFLDRKASEKLRGASQVLNPQPSAAGLLVIPLIPNGLCPAVGRI